VYKFVYLFFDCNTNCYFLKKGVLKRMVWPPQSPDLNPIEQVWEFVKSRLEESNKVTKRTIWTELEKAWRQVTPELAKKIYQCNARWVQGSYSSQGWPHQVLIFDVLFLNLFVNFKTRFLR
jgi:hypothetical protein